MTKKKIIVIECISTSVNYIQDIINEGYEPILMELYTPEENREESRFLHDMYLDVLYRYDKPGVELPERIMASESYEETLEMVREIDPELILPGGDEGIIWATRLSADLGLIGNNPDNLPKMRNKAVSQEALKQAGIRSIRGKCVESWEEALDFYHELGEKRIVVKPVSGGASVGVFICENMAQFEEAFKTDYDNSSEDSGGKGKVLLQEYIDGTEYIVNTVSCRGVHRVTSLLKYSKQLLPGKARIYDYKEFISADDENAEILMDYSLKMLDAIGLENGPSHNEIMIDENGPVLIEANCRLCGLMLRASWLDRILGYHESEIALNAYLHPEKFEDPQYLLKPVLHNAGLAKALIVYRDMFVNKVKFDDALHDLPGYIYSIDMGENRMYGQTIDLSTCGGVVYLAHKDHKVIEETTKQIQKMEKYDPEMLYDID